MPDDDEDGIFKVETVPPPEGESDVYNAPTKVGVLAGSIVEEIVQQARRQAELQGRAKASNSPVEDEPAVIDPMKLRALEELAARQDEALRSPPVPIDLVMPTPSSEPPRSAPPVRSAPPPRSAPPSRSAPPLREVERAELHVEPPSAPPPAPAAPSSRVDAPRPNATSAPPVGVPVPSVAPTPLDPPAMSVRHAPAQRSSTRASTIVILALIFLCLAFGLYRLRR